MWTIGSELISFNILGLSCGTNTRFCYVGYNDNGSSVLSIQKIVPHNEAENGRNSFKFEQLYASPMNSMCKGVKWDIPHSLIYSGDTLGQLEVLDLSGKVLRKVQATNNSAPIQQIDIIGNLIGVACSGGEVSLWDIRQKTKAVSITGKNDNDSLSYDCWALRPMNEKLVYAGYSDGWMYEFDIRSSNNPIESVKMNAGICSIDKINENYIIGSTVGGDIFVYHPKSSKKLINYEKSHGDNSTIWSVLSFSNDSNVLVTVVSSGSAGDVKSWKLNLSSQVNPKFTSTSTHFISNQAVICMSQFVSNHNLVICGSLDKQLSLLYVES